MKTGKEQSDPLAGPVGAVGKFLVAALFGGCVSILLFGGALWLDVEFLFGVPWIHAFWIIPVAWGVLGMLWFEPMVDAARHIVEQALEALGVDT